MNGYTKGRDEAQEEEILICDVSDEALELMADVENKNSEYSTFGWCTYMNICRFW